MDAGRGSERFDDSEKTPKGILWNEKSDSGETSSQVLGCSTSIYFFVELLNAKSVNK